MAKTPATFNPAFAYITGQNGDIFQVLNADSTDWDERATAQAAMASGAATGLPTYTPPEPNGE